jgi:hypothetical protein
MSKAKEVSTETAKHSDKSFFWVVIVVNITQLTYAATCAMGK